MQCAPGSRALSAECRSCSKIALNLRTLKGAPSTTTKEKAEKLVSQSMKNQGEKHLKQVTHSNTCPRPGQYLTHAHNNIARAVAAMDSCSGLVRPHQHGIAVGQR